MRFEQEYFPATVNSAWAHSAEHIPWSACFRRGLKEQKSLWHLGGDTQTAKGKFILSDQEGISLSCFEVYLYKDVYVCMYILYEASLCISMYMCICILMYVYVRMYIPA